MSNDGNRQQCQSGRRLPMVAISEASSREVAPMFQKNEGFADRIIRVLAGVLLVAVGVLVLGGIEGSAGGIVVAGFGLWFTVTGATGRCPLYVPFGISTVATRHGPFGITILSTRHEPSHFEERFEERPKAA
jgi:hypothetical protein